MSDPRAVPECLDAGMGKGGCSGPVEYRMPLSASGKSFPRCAMHWAERLAEHEQHVTVYPDSPIAPSWFDPAAAGERWDEDY